MLEREFRPGDVIEVRIPMTLAAGGLPGSQEYAALRFGPIVLAGRLGTKGLAAGSQLIVNERESGQMLNEPIDDSDLAPAVFGTAAGHRAPAGGAAGVRGPRFRGRRARRADSLVPRHPRALQPLLAPHGLIPR